MGTCPAAELVQRELYRALKDARRCIERVEMASAMLNGFNAPVPQYEPRLRHLPFSIETFELAGRRDAES